MEDLKQKAEKAIEEICGHLDTPTGCATLSDITRYIGWLEGQLLSKNVFPPVSISTPFSLNPPFNPGDTTTKPFVYTEPRYDTVLKNDKPILGVPITCELK